MNPSKFGSKQELRNKMGEYCQIILKIKLNLIGFIVHLNSWQKSIAIKLNIYIYRKIG